MSLGLSDELRNGTIDLIRNTIDAGGAAGKIQFYSADMTLLAEAQFSYPCAPDSTIFQLLAGPITPDEGTDAGVASSCNVTDSSGTFVLEADVGMTGSGAACIIDNTTISAGVKLTVTGFVINEPNG